MDVKPVSWVGDMYQKFEAMCVEVEDAVYQDTVKFVESQAKTVGTCVKRFYSDVMQDLLPLPSDDLVKPENPTLHSVDYPDNVIHDMSEVKIKRKPMKVSNEKLSKDSYRASQLGKEADNRLSAKSRDECDPCDELTYEESFGVKCPNLNVEQSYSGDLKFLPSEILAPEISVKGGTCEAEKGDVCEEVDETKKCVTSTSIITSSSMSTALDELPNDVDVSRVDGFSGMTYETIQDKAESDYANGQALQVSEIGKMKLEESCVLVNKYESFSPSHQESKQRSYKKKIKDVFIPRSWSRSKNQVHGQFTLVPESGSNEVNESSIVPSSPGPGNTTLQSNESFESGWEIL